MDVVSEPVHHVEEARTHVCRLQEAISVAVVDGLNSFDFEQRLCQSEQLPGLSYFLYIIRYLSSF